MPPPPRDDRRRERTGLVTGLGAVSPLGVGVPAFARALRAGASGLRPLDHAIRDAFDPPLRTPAVAQCWDFDPASVLSTADLARLPRLVPMALAAAREAMSAARLTPKDDEQARRIGLILGTGGGGIDFTLDQADAVHHSRQPSLWTITNATHGNLAGELSIRLGLKGPSLCVSDGCASSSDALGVALEQLRSNRPGSPDAWVVVGADAHVRWETLRGMELLKVIATHENTPERAHAACKPFDADRDGFILGEGAWAVVVEREHFARAREADTVGAVLGYGVTCDAYHRVRPDPAMTESVRAIELALQDGTCAPEDVAFVQYHGTGTQLNDAQETEAIKRAFGEPHARTLVGGSIKGSIGHPQGACGLASVVATLTCLGNADGAGPFFPPTINLDTSDPACDLDYCANQARALSAQDAAKPCLVNCLAFGAKNSALLVTARPG